MRVAVLTVSDSVYQGKREDLSGPVLRQYIHDELSATVVAAETVPDDQTAIAQALLRFCQDGIDLILTTGGTGLAPRDVTPEATRQVIEREVPGIAEAMRLEGLRVTRRAMLSRGIAGTRGRSLIINLPGSPKGAQESLAAVASELKHAVAILQNTHGHH